MEQDAFIAQVRQRADLASPSDAERAIRATLETLGQRLSGAGELANNLASQLPTPLGQYLHAGAEQPFEYLSLAEFLDKVREREGVELPEATRHARVVIEVLGEVLTGNSVNKIRGALPLEFAPLFENG